MQTLSEIKSLLASHGLRPKHRLGQNFLHDAHKIRQIVAAAEIQTGDRVLEVGPGTGALSQALLEAGAELTAVEVDRELEPILRQVLGPFGSRGRLIVADVLAGKHELNPQVVEAMAGRPFKVVANLPYNVASPLLANLVVDEPNMSLAVVMVQREVGERLLAHPGGRDYGPLGILVQAMCELERVTTLGPGCFWPQPKVDSIVVRVRRRARPLTAHPRQLAAMLQVLFQKRRKQIGTILGRDRPLPPGIEANQRPEQLSVEQLVTLSDRMGGEDGGW